MRTSNPSATRRGHRHRHRRHQARRRGHRPVRLGRRPVRATRRAVTATRSSRRASRAAELCSPLPAPAVLSLGPIAIGMPGTIDRARRHGRRLAGARRCATCRWSRSPSRRSAIRSRVLHDVKAAAFGELVAGAGIGQADAAYLNLGTGVSMAFVFGWKMHQGSTRHGRRDRPRGRRPRRRAVQLRPARVPRDRRVGAGDRPRRRAARTAGSRRSPRRLALGDEARGRGLRRGGRAPRAACWPTS